MQNKIAVVTGATSGIGAAYARKFAQRGYDLILTGRRKEKIDRLAGEIRFAEGVNVEVVLAELSRKDGIGKVIGQINGRPVDLLVNNAGFGVNSLYQECDLEAMEQLAMVNVLAPMELIRSVLPGMIRRNRGTIINISSESVFMAVPKNSVYSGAKAFVKSFTEGLALDVFDTDLRVMAVCPGLTHTDFHEKMGMDRSRQKDRGIVRWMSPEEVVEISLRDLEKHRIVCIPGAHTKMLTRALNLIPRACYYRLMYEFSREAFGKK